MGVTPTHATVVVTVRPSASSTLYGACLIDDHIAVDGGRSDRPEHGAEATRCGARRLTQRSVLSDGSAVLHGKSTVEGLICTHSGMAIKQYIPCRVCHRFKRGKIQPCSLGRRCCCIEEGNISMYDGGGWGNNTAGAALERPGSLQSLVDSGRILRLPTLKSQQQWMESAQSRAQHLKNMNHGIRPPGGKTYLFVLDFINRMIKVIWPPIIR